MRGLIENLSPENRQISWKWIGGVLAFYVVMMAAAMGMLAVHQSPKTTARHGMVAAPIAGKPGTVPAMPQTVMAASLTGSGQGD